MEASIFGRPARGWTRIGIAALTMAVSVFFAGSLAAAGPAEASSQRGLQTEDEEVTLDFDGCSTNLATGETRCIPDGQRATERDLCPDDGEILAFRGSTGPNNTGSHGHHCAPRPCTSPYDHEGPAFKANIWIFTNDLSWINTFHNCDIKLFDRDNQQGAASVWIDGHPGGVNLRSIERGLNNRANSYRLS